MKLLRQTLMYWQVMKMTKIYKGYADLPWFEDILDNVCESLVWFFEELLNDAEVQDLSIHNHYPIC